MKKILTSFLLLYSLIFLGQQPLENISTDCLNDRLEYYKLIPKYIENNNYQAAENIFDQWIINCGVSRPLIISRELFNIATAKDFDFKKWHFKYFFKLQPGNSNLSENPETTFYNALANALKTKELKLNNYQEALLNSFLGNKNQLTELLQQENFPKTPIQRKFNRHDKIEKLDLKFLIGIYTGLWIPPKEMQALKTRSLVGLKIGVSSKNTCITTAMNVRPGKAKSEVNLNFNDTLIRSKNLLGGYMGLELHQNIYKYKFYTLAFNIGIGGDGFNHYTSDTSNAMPYYFRSTNFSFGLSFIRSKDGYDRMYLEPRINFVNYNKKGIVPYKRNTFSIRLVIDLIYNQLN